MEMLQEHGLAGTLRAQQWVGGLLLSRWTGGTSSACKAGALGLQWGHTDTHMDKGTAQPASEAHFIVSNTKEALISSKDFTV